MIEIGIDKKDFEQMAKMLSPEEYKRAAVKATRRGLTAVRTAVSKETREDYRVKAADIKVSMKYSKVDIADDQAQGVVRISGPRLPLERFAVRKPKKGKLKAAVKKRGGLHPVSGLFYRTDRGTLALRTTPKRFPIKRPKGPAVAQMAGNDAVVERVTKRGQEVLMNSLIHEIEYRLGKSK